MAGYFLTKWFEDQLQFKLPVGTEGEIAFIGSSIFSPVEVLKQFKEAYRQEFSNWLNEEWKPRQDEVRQQILSYRGNAGRYSALKGSYERQQLIPLVGSGLSVPSGLPTWSNFLKSVAQYASCDLTELAQFINRSNFEEAADLLAGSMDPRLFAERVSQDLRINPSDTVNGPVCLLPSIFPNLVITTNLDNVIERTYELCNLPFAHNLSGTRISSYRQLKNYRELFLLKLHGDSQIQEGRVLLSNEYNKAYAPNSSVREEITLIFRQYSILFLGCSLGSDRTVQLIQKTAGSDKDMPKHYAFLKEPDNDVERVNRENFLARGNIFPIWYDSAHDEAIMALLDGLSLEDT